MTKKNRRLYVVITVIILCLGIIAILWPTDSKLPQAIGTSLIAGGIIALLELWYATFLDREAQSVKSLMDSGVLRAYDHRDIAEYHTRMSRLSNQLDITGFALRAFFESFQMTLNDRLARRPHLRLRVLVVDPDTDLSRAREQLEGHQPGTFATQIARMNTFFSQFPNQVEFRKLAGELTTMVFRIDDAMYVGPQFASTTSRSTPTLELTRENGGWLFEAFEREFENLWERSLPV